MIVLLVAGGLIYSGGEPGIRTLGRFDPSPDFKSGAFDQLCQFSILKRSYYCYLEAPPRFELGIEALQAPALPLGDGAIHSVNQYLHGAQGRT